MAQIFIGKNCPTNLVNAALDAKNDITEYSITIHPMSELNITENGKKSKKHKKYKNSREE